MKTLQNILLTVALALALVSPSFAQTQPTRTTLSNAVNAGSVANQVVVASATGISASTASAESYILVDRELMKVAAVSGTTLTVRRAQAATIAVAHPSGAQVFYGTGGGFNAATGTTYGVFLGGNAANPSGSCTRSANQFLPVFGIMSGITNGFTYDCLGGKWVAGTLPDSPDATPLTLACNVPIGSVAYGSLGTNSTDVNGQEWLGSIYVPKTGYVTGLKVLSGGTATTDNIYGILRDSAGTLLANSAAAGVLLSGASTFQTLAFTASRLVVGPARYFVSAVGNGTTAGALRTVAASTYNDVVATSASGTFGTITATFTVPTTFTADKSPVACLYY